MDFSFAETILGTVLVVILTIFISSLMMMRENEKERRRMKEKEEEKKIKYRKTPKGGYEFMQEDVNRYNRAYSGYGTHYESADSAIDYLNLKNIENGTSTLSVLTAKAEKIVQELKLTYLDDIYMTVEEYVYEEEVAYTTGFIPLEGYTYEYKDVKYDLILLKIIFKFKDDIIVLNASTYTESGDLIIFYRNKDTPCNDALDIAFRDESGLLKVMTDIISYNVEKLEEEKEIERKEENREKREMEIEKQGETLTEEILNKYN